MALTPEIERAARLAANKHYELVVSMLERGESGEVATVIEFSNLTPVKRVETPSRTIRVARGQSIIELTR